MGPLLELSSVSKSFGGLMAVHNVSFSVFPGTIKALIGPNGAGKSTLLNLISGILMPSSGRIMLCGIGTQGLGPHRLAALGMARTFQNVEVFGDMTVLENVMAGRYLKGRAGFWQGLLRTPFGVREDALARASALRCLETLGLAGLAGERAGDLPFGNQRLLEIARALATEPSLLLLDEVASGLSASEKRSFAELIRGIRDSGTAILMVEHDMELIMDISDSIVVLEYGMRIAEGPPEAIRGDERVLAAYLGGEVVNLGNHA